MQTNYNILSNSTRHELIDEVREFLKKGWLLLGPPFINTRLVYSQPESEWCQAVYKEENIADK